eukprot:TRINITY_DN1491_c0_g1_i1.p2 TRINITY_DN1491_c0_g1~~TRINITY_DN1491_c0_g1_i1.p2  ORF type:complete len:117 (+),score=9.08 TRINITY_DN1491_c0_g1_i1:140-490(+)
MKKLRDELNQAKNLILLTRGREVNKKHLMQLGPTTSPIPIFPLHSLFFLFFLTLPKSHVDQKRSQELPQDEETARRTQPGQKLNPVDSGKRSQQETSHAIETGCLCRTSIRNVGRS